MTNLLIEYQCSQCGAPAVLKETDRLFRCDYCRVKSYLMHKDCFRYVLPDTAPENKELVFFPYWRFKGMLFSCLPDKTKSKFADISRQAVSSKHFPASLGLRSQALKLRFVSPETGGCFLKPALPAREAMHIFGRHFKTSSQGPVLHQSFIGETFSLIYAPFYIADNQPSGSRHLFDAVLNKPLSSSLPDDFDISLFQVGHPEWRIRLIPTLCPNCGWDLDGERNAVALACRNCDSVWEPGGDRFRKVTFAHIPKKGDNVVCMPFWRIRADVSEIELDSYADMVRVANLPRIVKRDAKFYFWTPAFKIMPRIFLNLSRNITLIQPRQELAEELPNARLWPVTLAVTEAFESLKITLAGFLKPRKRLLTLLRDIKITPKEFLLIYVPFTEEHHEFVQPEFQQAVHKNVLAMSENL
ncbi:MAG: hypothetical protein DRI57_26010 [Deltaproteobacteria bacterium]|nr:MAG: hypothetical protein DRI57_26010 [Deltaproteobacteria bacterium]